MPSAASFITETDIRTWVNAAVGAALPPVMEETRGIFRDMMAEHRGILVQATAEHLAVMREQGRAMNRVMVQMNKLIAVAGSTLLLAEYLKSNPIHGTRRWLGLSAVYLGCVTVLMKII